MEKIITEAEKNPTDIGLTKELQPEEKWDTVVTPKASLLKIDFKELWRYRDLINIMMVRDIKTIYKQTILGPLWFVIQPILTSIMFIFIFGNVAKIGTEGIPKIVFYFSGITLWQFFSNTLTVASSSLSSNANIFGKVYFPRLTAPIAKIISGTLKLSVQYILFLGILFYHLLFKPEYDIRIQIPEVLLYTIIDLILITGIGSGIGLLLSSITIKYKDVSHLIGFIIQLGMYATPVVYPFSKIKSMGFEDILKFNPLVYVLENFRYIYTGQGTIHNEGLLYAFFFMLAVMFLGIIAFNKVEKNFIDTI